MPKTLFWQKSKGYIFKDKQSSVNMAAPPGNNFNPNGRPKGAMNETSRRVRETFAALLEGREQELHETLDRIREKDPKGYLELYIKISERFVPAMSRTEITGLDGEAIQPIQIILPKPNQDAE
jgi:hypothetical protein